VLATPPGLGCVAKWELAGQAPACGQAGGETVGVGWKG